MPQHWSCRNKQNTKFLITVDRKHAKWVVQVTISHLSLNIVNGPTLGVSVDAVILIKYFLDGTVHFAFYLNTVQCESNIKFS